MNLFKKFGFFLLSGFSILLISQCRTNQNVEYILPDNITENEKSNIVHELDLGKEIYKSYCSQCHGIFHRAKPHTPDFSKKRMKGKLELVLQLAATREPISHKMIRIIPPDDVNRIMGFIQQYKRCSDKR